MQLEMNSLFNKAGNGTGYIHVKKKKREREGEKELKSIPHAIYKINSNRIINVKRRPTTIKILEESRRKSL
jgi:hypothetical protein